MGAISLDNPIASSSHLTSTNLIVLGKNVSTGDVSAYAIGISMLTPLTGINKRLKNASTSENLLRDSTGSIVTDLSGDEELGATELTIEFKKDWNSKIRNQRYGISSNLYEAFITGATFEHDGDVIKCVSVLGVSKSGKRETHLITLLS